MFEVPEPIFNCMHNAGMAWQVAAAYAQDAAEIRRNTERALSMPHVRMRPSLSIDGNQWCALYGEDLVRGVAGFGDTPEQAMADFDRAWSTPLPKKENGNGK